MVRPVAPSGPHASARIVVRRGADSSGSWTRPSGMDEKGVVKRLRYGLCGIAALVAALAWWRSADAPLAGVRLVAVPAVVDGEAELFASEFGRMVVRPVARAGALQLRRHAHEVWFPLGAAEAIHSQGGRWVQERAPAGLYVPPYAMLAWKGDGVLLGFVAAPEDEPTVVGKSDPRLADAADALVLPPGEGRWMLDKLERLVVTGTRRLGPFVDDVASRRVPVT